MTLDLATLYVVQLTTFSLITTAMLLMGLRYQHEKALGYWGVAGVLACVGMALVALRPVLPLWLSVEVGNIVLYMALGLTWTGCQALEKQPAAWRQLGVLLGLASAVLLLISHAPRYYEWRAIHYSVVYWVFHGLALATLWRSPRRHRLGYRLVGILMGLLLLTHLGRMTLALMHQGDNLATAPSFVLVNFQMIMLEYGKMLAFIYLCFENLEIRLYHQAMRDPLTSLFNRRAFHEHAQERLAGLHDETIALLVLDLDYFKQVNDRYGHQAGDDVLVHLARLLHAQLSPFDALYARSGGEEFVVMLSGSAANMAPLIAENIRSALAAQPIQTSDAQLIAQTTSIGIASGQAGQASLRQLVMEADMALYQAKQKGRNCVCSSALSGQHPTASAAD